jgi:hypothetical protein
LFPFGSAKMKAEQKCNNLNYSNMQRKVPKTANFPKGLVDMRAGILPCDI